MSERLIELLTLFTLEEPTWTAEAAARQIGVSISSIYRYFARLADAGFLTTIATGVYSLGPTFIQYDRQIQRTDPLLQTSRRIMSELISFAPERSVVLLCQSFGERVLCVHQVIGSGMELRTSYERGRPMPLLRGATSTIILAHLPTRKLRMLFAEQAAAIADAGLGKDWVAFKNNLARIRKDGRAISFGSVDAGRVGIAAPVLAPDRRILGSLSYVISQESADPGTLAKLSSLIVAAAKQIDASLPVSDAIITL